jgi:hypothetical protein
MAQEFSAVIVSVPPEEVLLSLPQIELAIQYQPKIGQVDFLAVAQNVMGMTIKMYDSVLPEERDRLSHLLQDGAKLMHVLT